MPDPPLGPHYACKCLNIRIRPAVPPSAPADLLEDPHFIPVFVGEDGITVQHTQVTVRTRTRGIPIAGTSRFSRHTTITCLLCDSLVYRVYQTYPADVDGKEGPLLPTEDWVERDIMKSLSGWIDMHKECLAGKAVDEALSSPDYSAAFSLLLPQALPPPTSIEPIFERPSSRSSSSPPPLPPPAPKYFANLRPVFLPPPFTPSHPVFAHFASSAANQSQALRDAAEDYMNEQLKTKILEIENADVDIRHNVENVWKKFLDGIGLIRQERDRRLSAPTSRSRERAANGIESSSSPTPIRDFSPAIVPPAPFSPPSVARVSALSASLATSTFHHPRRTSTRTSPSPPGRSTSVPLALSADSLSNTSTLIAPQQRSPEGSNVLKYRRNLEETIDYATSYKYFVDLEKDMSRFRGRQLDTERSAEPHDHQNSTSHVIVDTTESDTTPKPHPSESSATDKSNQHTGDQEDELSPIRGREKASSKGKRKVTFDVRPAVVNIQTEAAEDKDDIQDQREMIFEFEENEEEGGQQILNFSRPTLQPTEKSAAPVRLRRQRPSGSIRLSSSFSGLRPASLPPPSNIRPPRSPHGSDFSVPSVMLPPPKPSMASSKDKGKQLPHPEIGPSVMRHGEEAVKGHVKDAGAGRSTPTNSPGNRGSWNSDSKAWQTFARRQARSRQLDGKIPEEGENDGDDGSTILPGKRNRPIITTTDDEEYVNGNQPMFVGSLPIPIQLRKPPPALSLASYQPKTLGAQVELHVDTNTSPARKHLSTTSIRKAVYAERDLLRSMDPGTLDFAAEEDKDVNETDVADTLPDSAEVGGRGRNRALKILQSQSEIPEAGMWRSLAS